MKKFLALTLLCGAMTLSLSAFTQAYESREVFCGPLEVIDHSYTVTIPRSCSQYIDDEGTTVHINQIESSVSFP